MLLASVVQLVRTLPSHGRGIGSNPIRGVSKTRTSFKGLAILSARPSFFAKRSEGVLFKGRFGSDFAWFADEAKNR